MTTTQEEGPSAAIAAVAPEGEDKNDGGVNSELWQACAGPLINLPLPATHVVYVPQGHSEQVAASLKKDGDVQVPNYSNLPSKLPCTLHSQLIYNLPSSCSQYLVLSFTPYPQSFSLLVLDYLGGWL